MLCRFSAVACKVAKGYNRACMSTIRYHERGSPVDVLKCEKDDSVSNVGPNQVALKFLAAPINHADLNMIEGNYSLLPELPAVAGNEGVAVVTKVGSSVKGLAVDDWVIPNQAGFGTWRNVAVADSSCVSKIPNDIPVEAAATLAVNPATAYRLLNDFVDLKEGDVILQNGANSAVGQAVIQLAHERGIKTVNVIRSRGDYEDVSEHLKALGGYIVCCSEYLDTANYKRMMSDLPVPKLALNCIGGIEATNLARSLGHGGCFVTYGGMSKKPVTIPTSLLIFKDIKLRGFWLTKWVKENSAETRNAMIQELYQKAKAGKLHTWIETYPFSEFDEALADARKPFRTRKIVLLMDEKK